MIKKINARYLAYHNQHNELILFMNIIKEISLILRPNRENKHFEKRIKAIEEVLRDCYKWTEQEIEAKKSEFPNKYEKTVEKYVY